MTEKIFRGICSTEVSCFLTLIFPRVCVIVRIALSFWMCPLPCSMTIPSDVQKLSF